MAPLLGAHERSLGPAFAFNVAEGPGKTNDQSAFFALLESRTCALLLHGESFKCGDGIQRKPGASKSIADVEELASSSLVGQDLFSPEVMLAELLHFKAEVDRRLLEVELMHFPGDEMASFKDICMWFTENLDGKVGPSLVAEPKH